jgi:hypothetical protein
MRAGSSLGEVIPQDHQLVGRDSVITDLGVGRGDPSQQGERRSEAQ